MRGVAAKSSTLDKSSRKARGAGADAPAGRLDWRNILLLTVAYVLVALLWETPIVYPLRLLVVFLHEISHGLAALATGGRIVELQIYMQEGGHCVTAGGNRFVILSAGYLGSVVFGAAILLSATRTRFPQVVAAALGLLLVYAAAMYVPLGENAFGKWFGVAAGGALAYLALIPPVWSRSALLVIGVTSCLYAVVDIWGDVLDRADAQSDASALASITKLSSQSWGVLWIGASVIAVVCAVSWSVRRT